MKLYRVQKEKGRMMKCDIGCSRNLHVTVTIGFTQSINARDETFMAIYLKLHELSQNKKNTAKHVQCCDSFISVLYGRPHLPTNTYTYECRSCTQ